MGIARVILGLPAVFGNQALAAAAAFDLIVTSFLSMINAIEPLRCLIEYFTIHRFKITFIGHGRYLEFDHAVDYPGEVFHRYCPFVILEDAARISRGYHVWQDTITIALHTCYSFVKFA
jgi:hypothetical protein